MLADFISRLNVGLARRLRFIRIPKIELFLRLLCILYKYGVIRTFRIYRSYIAVYFKYYLGQPIGKFTLMTRPGKRCY